MNRLGPQWLAERVGNEILQLARQLVARLAIRAQDDEANQRFTFEVVGHANRRRLRDRRVRDQH